MGEFLLGMRLAPTALAALLAASVAAAPADAEPREVFGAHQAVAPGTLVGGGFAFDGSLAVVSRQESGGATTLWRAERAPAAPAFTTAEPVVTAPGRLGAVAYARTGFGQEAITWSDPDALGLHVRIRPGAGQALGPVEDLPPPERAPVKPGNETVDSEPAWLSLGVALATDGALAIGGCEVDYRSETYRALVYFRAPGAAGEWRELGRCMATMRLRADATGRIDVLWSGAPDGSATNAPRVIWVATRAPGAPGLSPKQGLSDPAEDADNNSAAPELLTAPTGEAVALWNAGEYPVGNRALVAIRGRTGTWSAPQRVSGGAAAFRPSAAANVLGGVAVAWSAGQELGSALRSPGGTFAAPVVAPTGGEVSTQSMELALDTFETIVAVGRGVRDDRLYAVRRQRDGTTQGPVPVSASGRPANALRLETDPFGNGVLLWSDFPRGRPAETHTSAAPYSARPPLLEAVKVREDQISFDIDEPARITISARVRRRTAAQSAVVMPGRGREAINASRRVRTLLRYRRARRVVIRARDAGPTVRRVRRVLRRR